jgi:hypothetical protein
VLVALAVVYALPSLWYPFGRDQAAHAYVGWGWLRGAIPFRDAVDQKPPGIYLLYTLGAALFGPRQVGIRVLDLAGILGAGWLAARVARNGGRAIPGTVGATILLATGFYYTCFDYWNSAQVETWQGIAALAGLFAILRIRRPGTGALVAGALAGIAVLFKFTAGVFGLGLVVDAGLRAWNEGGTTPQRHRRTWERAGLVTLGGGAVLAAAGAYFAIQGALAPALDMLVRYNLAYGGWHADPAAARSSSLDFWLRNCGPWVLLLAGGWIGAIISSSRRRDGRLGRITWPTLGFISLGVLAVAVQGKFFSYHWGLLVPFLVLGGAHGLRTLAERRPAAASLAAVGALAIGLLLAPEWICNRAARAPAPVTYREVTARTWRYALGKMPRADFLPMFDGGYGYRYADQEALGQLIRERAQPGDQLLVRGFEPTLYAVSGLRAPTRFFIELQLQERQVKFAREAWLEEYRQAIETARPRFVVVLAAQSRVFGDEDRHGYRVAGQQGNLVLYQRG